MCTVPWALVNEEVELQKFSHVAVPTISAPALSTLVTTVASVVGVQAGKASLPKNCGTPATAMQSFRQTVLPLRSDPDLFLSP